MSHDDTAPSSVCAAADGVCAEALDALLPQTQCRRCGYDGCAPYAGAIAAGEAPINRCPPGGASTIAALALLLGREVLPLDPACGTETPAAVAWIDANACIGCARCLPACPVDAIIGAPRYLHTVYEPHCTGCELCLASCPVDCIRMRPRPRPDAAPPARDNRGRYYSHHIRHERRSSARAALLEERKRTTQENTAPMAR